MDDLRSEMNARFDAMNARFDILQSMFGLFVTIFLVILGFVLRMQWQMQRRLTRLETAQALQGDHRQQSQASAGPQPAGSLDEVAMVNQVWTVDIT
jgi:hypothetical protein